MPRVALPLALMLCGTALPALAEDATSQTPKVALSHKVAPKKAVYLKRKSAKTDGAVSAVQPIVGGLETGESAHSGIDVEGAKKSTTGGNAWSVSPQWNAANGGSSAAYGTRALVNELQSNPAETTGYGAGAKVDFHF